MYDIEREKNILEILKERGSIGVNRLASLVFCSGSTIRRDLSKLEKKGLVKRSFGFVSLATEVGTEETSFSNREIVNISIKKHLSKAASMQLNNSQTIFIDSSTTLLFIAPFLNEFKNLLKDKSTSYNLIIPDFDININTRFYFKFSNFRNTIR